MSLPQATGRAARIRAAATRDVLRREISRKALHLSSAVVPVAYALGTPRTLLLALVGALLAVAVGVEAARRVSPSVRRLFIDLVGPLLRDHEHRGVAGATWMLAAYAGALWLTPAPAAITAMWAVAAGDALAAIVGRTLAARRDGRTARRDSATSRAAAPPRRDAKTWWGTVACAGVTSLGAIWLAGLTLPWALGCGVAAALAERPAWPVDDNVRIVLAVCALLMLAGGVPP